MAEVAQDTAPSRATRHFLTFRLGKARYALAAEGIAEVVRIPAISRLPQAPSGLMGVANLRGDVVPVADIGRLLQRVRAPGEIVSRAIVMRGDATVATGEEGATRGVRKAMQ